MNADEPATREDLLATRLATQADFRQLSRDLKRDITLAMVAMTIIDLIIVWLVAPF